MPTAAKPIPNWFRRYFPNIDLAGDIQDYAKQTVIAALTDNSGGSGSDTIASLATSRPVFLPNFYTLLTSLDTPANIATYTLPFAGKIISWGLMTRVPATSGGTADADIDLLLDNVPITGAKLQAFTQADLDTIGKFKAGGTITAANTFAAGAVLKVTCTESAVNFTAGAVDIIIFAYATETALPNAIASNAAKINEMIASQKTAGQMASS